MARFLAPVLGAVLVLSGCTATPARRAYVETSVWNQTIAQKGGTLASSNPYAGEFGGNMIFGGGPGGSSSHDRLYAKPIFLATVMDPCRSVTLRNPSWNNSNTRIPNDACVPVPDGLEAAGGSDGHLTIVSLSEPVTMWAFWRCKMGSDSGAPCTESNVLTSGYQAANGSVWKIHPDDPLATGVASCCGSATSRGSGTELLTTVLRADEAEYGIGHAMGLTIPDANSSYINPPAIKSDGGSGDPIKYGSLWALRPDYPCPSAKGPRNVCEALKEYGAFIVDQGASFELDTAGDYGWHTVARWQHVGITRNALPLSGSDMRCVSLPTVSGECP